MTTDTAVRVTRIVAQEKGDNPLLNWEFMKISLFRWWSQFSPFLIVALEEIQYIDYPELRINENESTEMPFRYVKGSDGQPIMPEVHCPQICCICI